MVRNSPQLPCCAGGLTLDAIEELLDRKLHPIKARLDAIDARLDAMDARQRIMAAKQHNSLVGREDRLQVVPLESGVLPKSEFPQNLVQLMVAGSESRPQAGGGRVGWSKVKSQGLLLEYGESGYVMMTDGLGF